MTNSTAGPHSWIPPELAWIERTDILALEVPLTVDELIQFMAEGSLEIQIYPSENVGKFYALILGNRLRSTLSIAFSSDPSMLLKTDGSEKIMTTRAYWHGSFILPGADKVLVLAGVKKPTEVSDLRDKLLINEVARVFEKHKEELAAYDRETEEITNKNKALYAKYPELKKYDYGIEETRRWNQRPVVTAESIANYFQKAVYFPLGRITNHDRITRESVKQVSHSGWPLPREGSYEGLSTYDAEHRKIFITTWQPYGGLPAYPEVRWAVQRQLPRTIRNPRLTESDRSPVNATEQQTLATDWGDDIDWQDAFTDLQFDDTDYQARVSSIRKVLSQQGFEAIAWYQAFHFWTEDTWGIYFDAAKIDDLALTIFDECRMQRSHCQFDLCARLAFGLIYNHEFFHARVEATLSWLELNASRSRYQSYFNNVYKHLAGTDEWLEEALANWSSWQWYQSFLQQTELSRVHDKEALTNVVEAILDLSPAGYNNWRVGHQKVNWKCLTTQIVKGRAKLEVKSILPLESLLSGTLPYDFRKSDIPLFFVGEGLIADRLQSLPSVINIPARKEIARALRYFQYMLDSAGGKGSHEKWIGPDNRAFILPRRDPLSRGVFKSFLDHFNIDKMTYAKEIRPNI